MIMERVFSRFYR